MPVSPEVSPPAYKKETWLGRTIESGKRIGIMELEDNVLTVKNEIVAYPEKNQLVIPMLIDIKTLRETDRETYEQWLKKPELAVEGIKEKLKDRMEKLGIDTSEVKITPTRPLTRTDIEEPGLYKDYAVVSFAIEVSGIPEHSIPIDLVRKLAFLSEDVREEAYSLGTSLDFITEAIERGKEKLKEIM